MQRFLQNAFVKSNTRTFSRVNNFFALLTIVSIVSLVLETVPSFAKYSTLFFIIEWTAVILFTFEYLGRLYISKPVWKYSTSFFGVVDLVAILPTFLGLGNFTFLKSARALRIIRLLRMIRLAKITRIKRVSDESLGPVTLNVSIYFVTLICALLFTGTAMYLTEPELFLSIPVGMWWSFKVFMGSMPVVFPDTSVGEGLFVATRFIGLLLLGLLVGVVGNVFKVLVVGRK